MSIPEVINYDKEGNVVKFPLFKKLFLAIVIILLASLSFGLGRLSVVGEQDGVKIEFDPELAGVSQSANVASVVQSNQNTAGKLAPPISGVGVVASKNGSKYHYPHCSGAKQIKEANKITFSSAEEAQNAGYTLAANCKTP